MNEQTLVVDNGMNQIAIEQLNICVLQRRFTISHFRLCTLSPCCFAIRMEFIECRKHRQKTVFDFGEFGITQLIHHSHIVLTPLLGKLRETALTVEESAEPFHIAILRPKHRFLSGKEMSKGVAKGFHLTRQSLTICQNAIAHCRSERAKHLIIDIEFHCISDYGCLFIGLYKVEQSA